MPDRFNEYVHRKNIEDFTRKLEAETDPQRRKLLAELLKAERDWKLPHPGPKKGRE